MKRRRRRRPGSDELANLARQLHDVPAFTMRVLGLGASIPRRRVGAIPGTLPSLEDHEREPARITLAAYGPNDLREKEDAALTDVADFRRGADVLWVHVSGVRDPETLDAIGQMFSLHPLVMEDLANTHQRPKQEYYPGDGADPGHLFLVVKMLRATPETGEVAVEQLGMVVGRGVLLTFQERPSVLFAPIRERLRQGAGRIRREGPDYLAYLLIDYVVDHYFEVIERIGDQIDALEQLIVEGPEREHQEAIRVLRRNVLFLRRSIWPLREVLASLQRDETPLIAERTRFYMRDVYDHIIQVVDFIEIFRDVLATLSELYVSSLSHRLNEVMKVLTVVGTIFIPLSFLTGIYGMNFEHMPELGYRYGYFIFLGFVAILLIGSLTYFRRQRWI